MGFRFRRSVRIAPGIRLNFSKSGISTSIGGKGATVNLSKRGTRTTIGVPGTGISYSTISRASPMPDGEAPPSSSAAGCGILAVIGFTVMALVKCSGSQAPSSTSAAIMTGQTVHVQAVTKYVTTRSLNCRATPGFDSTVVAKLSRGSAVSASETQGTWTHIATSGHDCWGSASFLSDLAPSASRLANGRRHARHEATSGSAAASTDAVLRHDLRHAGSAPYYGYNCPCSGARICVGRRGGRYCITAGGNKRYGM